MSENVEVRRGDSVASLVDQLAKSVTESSITLPVDREIPEGEWVRFMLKLADGTDVMEGIGRSRGSMPRGNPVDHHDLVLVELTFDERNEIMWERLLIAAEAAETGDDTGTIALGDGSVEELIPDAAAAKPPALPTKGDKPRASGPPPPAAASKAALASKPPPAASRPPAAAASRSPSAAAKPPAAASKPPAAASEPSPAARPSGPPASSTAPAANAKPAGKSADRPHSLEVPQEVVAEARRLTTRLPTELVKDRAGNTPDNVVLLTALRMGLAALDAQTRRGDS